MVVGADRAGPVTELGLQPHQGAVAGFLQRLHPDPAPGRVHRHGQVAGPRRADQVAQVHALAFQVRPGLGQPVVVLAGQQVTAVLGEGAGGVRDHGGAVAGRGGGLRGRRRGGKRPQVDPAARRVLPAQVAGSDDQGRIVIQDLAQVVHLAAQVGQRLRVGRVRPEQPGDPLPGLRRPGPQRQEGDQGDGARRRPPDVVGLVAGDGLLTQQ